MNKKLLLVLTLALIPTICACQNKNNSENQISVMLVESEGFSVTSQNPVKISSGENAVFSVTTDKDYTFSNDFPKNVTYKNGKITVSSVKYPKTVELSAVSKNNKQKYTFSLQSLSGGGYTYSNKGTGKYPYGTKITVSATPKKDYEFLGWSEEKTLAQEGKLVSTDKAYTFILHENITIHANFKNTAVKESTSSSKPVSSLTESRIILYNPNGGSIVNSNDEFYTAQSYDKYFLMPNTLPGANEIFVKEGYKLIGFSDTPDGSGNFYGIGHTARFAPGEKSVTTFYCIWEKYSDLSNFSHTEYQDGIMITGYTGNEETVVIPEFINGKKVIRLAQGAISGSNIKTLMLPYTLVGAESGAICNCPQLEKVHISDGVTDFPNDAFAESAKFKTLHIDALVCPAYTSNYRNFSLKYQYLLSLPNDKPKLVVLSGSNTDHGVDTLEMEKALNNKYYCVNFGTDAAFNITVILDCVGNMLNKGDYLIHNFEQMDYCRGSLEFNALTFQGFESNYGLLLNADISKYSNIFESLCKFNETRGKSHGGNYNVAPGVHNKRGEKNSIQSDYNDNNFFSGSNGRFEFSNSVISTEEAQNLNVVYSEIQSKGVTVLISYPSFNINAVLEEYRNTGSYNEYDEFIKNNLTPPLISVVKDYIFPGKYMSNTDYHLNAHGRTIRTAKLLRDFCNYTKDSFTPIDVSNEDLSFWED